MLKMRKVSRNSRKGFTLIELVVCVCILVILAAILVPKVSGMKDQAKIAADQSSIATMNNCIALHCASNNYDNLVGQTSINCPQPIKQGDSVTAILKFLQDKGLLESGAQIYFSTGHVYNMADNRVN